MAGASRSGRGSTREQVEVVLDGIAKDDEPAHASNGFRVLTSGKSPVFRVTTVRFLLMAIAAI
jgi:hypothetical protein